MIKTAQDIKRLGTILGVWAHPDDETFSMGGIMAAAVSNGQRVVFITATRGEKGVQDETKWPAVQLGSIRSKELEQAMKILGVTEHEWLDYPDGGCKQVDEKEAVNKLGAIISRYQPDSIFTFGPEGMTGHPDHRTVSEWTRLAHKASDSRAKFYFATLTADQYEAAKAADENLNMFFAIEEPPVCQPEDCTIYFDMGEELCSKKIAALKAMPSQYAEMAPYFEESLKISFGIEAFIEAFDAK